MLRSAMIACSLMIVALMVTDADAGRRGCRGGDCSTGGCRGGVCPIAQADATGQADAAVEVVEEPTTGDAVVTDSATPEEADTATEVTRRFGRNRSRSRRRSA